MSLVLTCLAALGRPLEQHELRVAGAFVTKRIPGGRENAMRIGFEFDVHEGALGHAIRAGQCL